MWNLPALVMMCAPQIDPTTLLAVIAVESAANPYAVSINSPERLKGQGIEVPPLSCQPRSAEEALALIAALHARGLQVSVGLAQVNEIHLPALARELGVTELAALLEPCANLKAAAWVLQGCWTQVGAEPGDFETNGRIHRALSCFNTGHARRGLANGYVWRVFRTAQGLSPPSLSEFLCVEPYTAREGEEIVWRRTTQGLSRRRYWTSCLRGATRRACWIREA